MLNNELTTKIKQDLFRATKELENLKMTKQKLIDFQENNDFEETIKKLEKIKSILENPKMGRKKMLKDMFFVEDFPTWSNILANVLSIIGLIFFLCTTTYFSISFYALGLKIIPLVIDLVALGTFLTIIIPIIKTIININKEIANTIKNYFLEDVTKELDEVVKQKNNLINDLKINEERIKTLEPVVNNLTITYNMALEKENELMEKENKTNDFTKSFLMDNDRVVEFNKIIDEKEKKLIRKDK